MNLSNVYREAALALTEAEALVITAGAGMGVDSGLPDFRGDHGFWKAYPMYAQLGINFIGAATPTHFESDPCFGWGFYGHRTNLYRETIPHQGFHLLQTWQKHYQLDTFVVTSNVDGQFQKAGFPEERVVEVHGSIHHLQCLKPCCMTIWPNRETIPIDTTTMKATHIPRCPRCGGVARPNILMFGDYSWISDRSHDQEERFDAFLGRNRQRRLLVIELGAGSAIPTIRHLSERLGQRPGTQVVRINPREAHIGSPHLSLPVGALEGLTGIAACLPA
ncbi:Sir2 family NAD-dependent protein deacetylase [Desulfuromonas sp. AOP6]|uniref:SIR2 family NAD-dependent protein deacylase n=1 Tax=Desulfuromonas sp. AOP6 TaxID=1566351 RepID=UPI0012703F86|nr:Sir2 family NAD-dependent protein deacetylase [Desulfuromonas sp. AOP6]BCA79251.1 NAD-dependent protein deacetylase [Desulfuromonas sp. AOP6]